MIDLSYPLRSLAEGSWFKLICGASFQHLPAVRNLTLAYALAGIDCVDVAADPAVIAAAQEGIKTAEVWMPTAQERGFGQGHLPWLMVSLNDGEDPHFRKAAFDPTLCPSDCPRPCETICPAQAIAFTPAAGVIAERCYGCGRCLPICPVQQITTQSYVFTPEAIAPLVLQGVDAVEIHTQVGRFEDFRRLWRAIAPQVHHLKLIAISCPDGEALIDYIQSLYTLISPLPCPVVWQTDGRPMSGDIGEGATRAALKLGQKVLGAGLPGYVQLAGGTNHSTVPKLRRLGLLSHRGDSNLGRTTSRNPQESLPDSPPQIAGVAYGSYARVLLSPLLDRLEGIGLEETPDLLWQAVDVASSLTAQLKAPQRLAQGVPRSLTLLTHMSLP